MACRPFLVLPFILRDGGRGLVAGGWPLLWLGISTGICNYLYAAGVVYGDSRAHRPVVLRQSGVERPAGAHHPQDAGSRRAGPRRWRSVSPACSS
jgi:hypothetical protein